MSQHDNVSNSIFSILAAFTNGLNIFKKLREQKVKDERKRTARTTRRDGRKKDPPVQGQSKTTVHHGTVHDDRRRKAENQLSKSLREGSRSIRTEYENGYEKAGRVFETGDGKFLVHECLCSCRAHINYTCSLTYDTHIKMENVLLNCDNFIMLVNYRCG